MKILKFLFLFISAIAVCAAAAMAAPAQKPPQPAPGSAPPNSVSEAVANATPEQTSTTGSPYVPVDCWVYPAMDRLYALGYVDTAYLGLRPWTRMSIAHMLERSAPAIEAATNDQEAQEIYLALMREFQPDVERALGVPRFHVAAAKRLHAAARHLRHAACATAITSARAS